MKKIYQVRVKLLSALHINGGTNADGVRITVKQNGQAYIPATLFKGIVRGNYSKMVSLVDEAHAAHRADTVSAPCSCSTCKMFGRAGFQQSRIIFDNLECRQPLNYMTRTNVGVDRYLQTSMAGALVFTQVVEPFDADGMPVEFSGQITAYFTENQKAEEACLWKALELINCIGLGKSRGLGFVEVSVNEAESGI